MYTILFDQPFTASLDTPCPLLFRQEYPNILIKMLNASIKEPHSHLAVFVMKRDGSARLDFIQNMEYKFVELLSCNFARSPEEVVRQQITYRYNSARHFPQNTSLE